MISRTRNRHKRGMGIIAIRSLILLITVLSCLPRCFAAETTPHQGIRDKTPQLRAFTGARIVVSPDLTYEKGTLLIDDGRIVAVGDNVTIPVGATVIDLRGYAIYPGFIDPLTSYGLVKPETRPRHGGSGPQYETERKGGNAWNEAVHAERNWIDEFKPDQKEAKELIEQGFATVQSARLDGIFRGRGFVATLRNVLPNDVILRDKTLHFLSFDKGSSTQDYPTSLMGAIALVRQTLYDVDWYLRAHAAYQLDPDQKLPEFNAAIEALANVKNEKILFETGSVESLLRAQKIAEEFGLSLAQVGSGYEYVQPDAIKATNAAVILPVNYPEAPPVKTLEDQLDVTLADLRHWERAPTNAAVLEAEGVRFAFTSHRLKKKSDFLNNVRKAIRHGLSRESALAALTTVPAEICGIADQVGSLKVSKLANFIVCDKDIFDDEAEIYSVWIQGEETEVKPLPEVDFRGNYRLSLADKILQLELKGKVDKPSGQFTIGEKSDQLANLSVSGNKIEFALKLDTLGSRGLIRFSGRLVADTLLGQCVTGGGQLVGWVAPKTGAYIPEEDTSKAEPEAKPELISRLTYPNKAFGFEIMPPQQDILVRGAAVWTSGAEGILENADILVRDGKFAAIGQGLENPGDVAVVDVGGKHVTPGIIDEHSHIAIAGDVNEGSQAVTSEVRIADVVDPTDINIYRQLTGGVTTSHLLHGSANPIGGQVQVIKLKWGSDADELKLGAPPDIKFALGENVKQSNWGDRFNRRYPQSRTGVEAIIRDAFQAAREYQADWQSYRSLDEGRRRRTVPPRRDLGLEALLEVLNGERFVACHAYMQAEMLMLIRLAENFGFRIRTFEHGLEAYKVAPELAAHGVGVSSFADWWAYKFEVYDAIPQSPGLCTEKGMLVSINSDDADHARRLNQEAAKSVTYTDMDPEAALKMVTINPARQLMIEDRIGSIEVGKDADFVIWDGPPLSIFSKPLETWIEGRRYFDIETDLEMREQIRAEKNALVQKILTETDKHKEARGPKDDTDVVPREHGPDGGRESK